MTLPVIAVVGLSNSGKTRVATALIQVLSAKGYRIAAVKHAPHGHQIDRPNTDSARLFGAGAAKIVVSSPGQRTSIERTKGDEGLEEIVATLDSSYDLVVAEGFKGSKLPKVLVVGAEEISPPPKNVIAVVGDHCNVEDVPAYSFEELDSLATHIQKRVLGKTRKVPAISLMVEGVPIPLGPFPSRALAGTVRGFLTGLKDVPPNPESIRIELDAEATRVRTLRKPNIKRTAK